jgi:hypothetical protein
VKGEDAEKLQQLKSELARNPDSESFLELAQLLQDTPEGRTEARDLCFRGISRNPQNALARLVLARLFYLDSLFEFSVRELIELREICPLDSVDKLISEFGPQANKFLEREERRKGREASAPAGNEDSVVAEVDLDADFLEVMSELDEKE